MSSYADDAQLRIADLGSAFKLKSPTDKTRFQIGTPGYIAPEILLGQPYSFSCDIWSIGALMFVLLSAQLPFWDNNRSKRKQRVCTEPLDLE
jgi:serine/threonine protein kinase